MLNQLMWIVVTGIACFIAGVYWTVSKAKAALEAMAA